MALCKEILCVFLRVGKFTDVFPIPKNIFPLRYSFNIHRPKQTAQWVKDTTAVLNSEVHLRLRSKLHLCGLYPWLRHGRHEEDEQVWQAGDYFSPLVQAVADRAQHRRERLSDAST